MQDSKGRIWISTDRGGICRYNSQTDDFTSFPLKTVCRMMSLIRYWKMNNRIYGSGQIGDWLDLTRNRKTCGYILLRMVY